jgi:hypothetical protein
MTDEKTLIPLKKLEASTQVAEETKGILKVFVEQTLISPEDIKALNAAKDFAISSFVDTPQYRPMIVKLASVLSDGQFPTADAKFWQCKAEAEVHFNELVRNVYKIESIKVDVDEMDYKIGSLNALIESNEVPKEMGDPILMKFDLKRLQIKRESLVFEMKLMEKNTKYRIEEVTDWCSIAGTLIKDCKYSLNNKQEGMVETLYKKLDYEISKATDEKTKSNLMSQLNTLKRLLFEKAKKNI